MPSFDNKNKGLLIVGGVLLGAGVVCGGALLAGASPALAVAIASCGALAAVLRWQHHRHEAALHRLRDEMRQRNERAHHFVQRLMDVIPEPVYVKDARGYYLLVNQAFCQQRGQSAREILGHSIRELLPDEVARVERVTREDAAVIQGQRVFKEEVFHRPFTGEARNRIISKGSCLDAEGRTVIVGTNIDITDWRRAESRLQAALDVQARFGAFLQTVFDALPSPLYVKDEQHRFLLANQALGAALCLQAAELTGKRAGEVLPGAAADALEACESRLLELTNGVVGEEEIVLFDAAGNAHSHGVRIVASTDLQGRRVLIGIHTDITAQRAFDAEVSNYHEQLKSLVQEQTASLLVAKEAAEQSNETKSQFLANISHELRTPMHAILSFARIGVERTPAGDLDKLQDYFRRIVLSGERMLALVNNLLDLSKLEAGQMPMEQRPVDLRQVVDDGLREFEALLLAKHMQLSLQAGSGLLVVGDALRLGQVVRNLLSNALRFSPDGSQLELSIAESRIGSRHHHEAISIPALELVVADRGPGIPPAELERIFDKFYQSSATASGAGGTGLGLAICREIALGHRGQIFARNRDGGGAEFVLRIPTVEVAVETVPVSL